MAHRAGYVALLSGARPVRLSVPPIRFGPDTFYVATPIT